eukprot:2612803-Prymnesium_polylepis.1
MHDHCRTKVAERPPARAVALQLAARPTDQLGGREARHLAPGEAATGQRAQGLTHTRYAPRAAAHAPPRRRALMPGLFPARAHLTWTTPKGGYGLVTMRHCLVTASASAQPWSG